MELFLEEEYSRSLQKIGLTSLQAKIYMVLVRAGKEKTLTISKMANADRSNTYRTILQLQKMGLVTKILGIPNLYRAVPLKDAVSALIDQKKDEYEEMQEVAEELKRISSADDFTPKARDCEFSIVKTAKEKTRRGAKHCCETAKESIDFILNRKAVFLTIIDLAEYQLGCVKRGVKYRIVSEYIDIDVTKELTNFIAEPNFQIRYIREEPKTELIIVDKKAAVVSLFPHEEYIKKTQLFSNHSGCIEMFQSHFDKIWNEAHEYPTKNKQKRNKKQLVEAQ
ncbi:MAG: hypothetical protein NWF00_07545 [Candidatus Bathyarchaeota archaeon]|nr:hypothetical protein [Candidatus Bathyarchaeota archaeon]